MTEDEVEVVAAELAKAGGVAWYPGRERGPLKHVVNRYRDRARLAIAASIVSGPDCRVQVRRTASTSAPLS